MYVQECRTVSNFDVDFPIWEAAQLYTELAYKQFVTTVHTIFNFLQDIMSVHMMNTHKFSLIDILSPVVL